MMKVALLLVALLGLFHCGDGALYGLVTGATQTQTFLETVQVDPTTGNFTLLKTLIVYVGASLTYDGISGFDQKHNYLYYSTNFGNAFVFGLDVAAKSLIPPISVNALSIDGIEWDNLNSQLLITGTYQDNSQVIVTYPDAGNSKILLNYTTYGISNIYSSAVDSVKGVYYFAYFDPNAQVFNIGSFAISNPSTIAKTKLNCGTGLLAANFLFYDSNLNKILGIGFNTTSKAYNYFEVVSGTCTVKPLGLPGIVTCVTYDPTVTTLYLGYTGDTNALLFFNSKTYALSKIATSNVLSDIQVSYKV